MAVLSELTVIVNAEGTQAVTVININGKDSRVASTFELLRGYAGNF